MPLRNRVTPEGDILAVPQRGTMYGNRGSCFHRDDGTLKSPLWGNRQWICCVLDFKDRRRVLRQPGKFTELFFLDEATAFAAGHRPCFECRRADAERFRSLWTSVRGLTAPIAAPAMDIILHDERVDATTGIKRVVDLPSAGVPDGAMVRHAGQPHLVWQRQLRPWSFDGYGPPHSWWWRL